MKAGISALLILLLSPSRLSYASPRHRATPPVSVSATPSPTPGSSVPSVPPKPTPATTELRRAGLVLPTKNDLKKRVKISVPFEFGASRQIEPPFSLRKNLPPPQDQGVGVNSCVGWTVGDGLMSDLFERPSAQELSGEYLYIMPA